MNRFLKILQKQSKTDMTFYLSIKNINRTQINQIKSFINSIDFNENKDYINLNITENNLKGFDKEVKIEFKSIQDINNVFDKYILNNSF